MEIVEIKAQSIEQLRDVFYGRDTYHNIGEWLEHVASCIEEICTESNMMTAQMEFDRDQKTVVALEIGEIVIRDLERSRIIAKSRKEDQ
tara:strand:+ start:211 stop:477 length:267 start_codon:yes stop_codon:yes gene_type:complete